MKHRLTLLLALAASLAAAAQDGNLGTWASVQASHSWNKTWYGSLRLEHRSLTATDAQGRRGDLGLDLWFARATVGAKLLPWLKADLGMDRVQNPDTYKLRLLPSATLTLKQGHLTASLRERYVASFTPSADAANQWSHVLRSYLKVGYHAPGHLLAPYLAVELYAWEQWQKTHHFAGVQLRISSRSTLDLFYLFATDKKKPDAHILGLGYDINI
ncbi:MAG: DUF2490 domain-containing protein [Bacteroidales bacterium]|nr:DUF2490 domain-containing protein [Bacteroidales bacterium]